MNPKAYRLPTHVLPRQYNLEIDTRLSSDDFGGSITIDVDVVETRDFVELHARDLRISQATFAANGRKLNGAVELDPDREVATIRFAERLPTGPASLRLDFAGQVNKGLEGLYRAVAGDEHMLCTQCEATAARLIFPCFDEPTFKARFAVRVTSSADVTVLANAPLETVTASADGASKTWSFAPTKPMSSYLFALAIGDISSTPEETVNGIPLRIWAVKGKEQMGEFGQAYTARLLPWYEDYFGAPYHFDKYDQVAVPGFAAGAMENSGLVLFRQSLLLMDPKTTSWEQEKYIASVVAHEFAHMWFGNLVTMRWWDDLWLNEAFAEWVAIKVVDQLSPDYHIWDDFQSDKAAALRTDALENTHPIYTPVETPQDAEELFDVITYQKGCAVLRMIESFLGESRFRDGIRGYMQEFAESNAAGDDLWRNLQNASDEPVATIVESWILQPGHPCVEVTIADGEGSAALQLRQQRFFSNPNSPSAADQIWQIPLVIRYEDDEGVHVQRKLMVDHEDTVNLPVSGTLRWVYANAGEVGFYRQNPDRSLLDGLLDHLDRLKPSEQMGLLADQWALVRNGSQNITHFLDLLDAMKGVDNYNVASEVVSHLHTLEDLLEQAGDHQALDHFRAWVNRSFKEKQATLGFVPRPDESRNDTQQRRAVVDAMANLAQDREALDQSEKWARREADDPAAVDPNLASIFISARARVGDANLFDEYVNIYQRRRHTNAAPQEADRYLASFVHFRAPDLVERILELMDEGVIPQESKIPILRGMLGRTHTQRAGWGYLKANWQQLQEIGGMAIPALVGSCGQLPIEMRDEVVAFLDAHLDGAARNTYARAMENMELLAEFKSRTRDDLIRWFRENGSKLGA